MDMKVIRKDGGVTDLESLSQHKPTSEETPNYKRISGTELAGNPKEAIQEIVEQFRQFDISPHMLKEMDTFEQTFVALMLLKFRMMVAKQKDYGPGNIGKAGLRGIITRATDKLERIKTLVGDPETQVESSQNIIKNIPDDASFEEMDKALFDLYKILVPGNAVQDERIDDTLMDLGNYGDIAFVLYHRAWGKALEENL
jgi:hypothetical protein